MSFQTRRFEESPLGVEGNRADVQIIFDGQLMMRSDGQGCDVAVNPIATGHTLSIEARIKRDGETDRIAMRHLGPLNFRLSSEGQPEGMRIEVVGGAAPAAPAAFKLVTANGPLDLKNPAEGTRPDDFRWMLNLEGPQFHNAVLNAPIFGSQNVIRLRNGEYYFRTAARVGRRFRYRRSGGGQGEATFGSIGVVAAASVFLADSQALVMHWQDGTREDDRVLTLDKVPGTHYEIYIENSPLFLDPPTPAELASRDELIEYYKLLPGVPAFPLGRRFRLVPEPAPVPDDGDLGSPSVPCQVVTLDEPGGG